MTYTTSSTTTSTSTSTSTSSARTTPRRKARLVHRVLAGAAIATVPLAALGGAAHAEHTAQQLACDNSCVITVADGDADGFSDLYELAAGSNAADPSSTPDRSLTQEGLDARVLVRVTFGGPSFVTVTEGLPPEINPTLLPDGTLAIGPKLVDPVTGKPFTGRHEGGYSMPGGVDLNAASRSIWGLLGAPDGKPSGASAGNLPGQAPGFEPPEDDRTLYGVDGDADKNKGEKKMSVWEDTYNADGSKKESVKDLKQKSADMIENTKCGMDYTNCVSPDKKTEKAKTKKPEVYYTNPDADNGGGSVDTSKPPADPKTPYVQPVNGDGTQIVGPPKVIEDPNDAIVHRDPDAPATTVSPTGPPKLPGGGVTDPVPTKP